MKFYLVNDNHVHRIFGYGLGYGAVHGSGFGHGSYSVTYRGNGSGYGFNVGGDGEGFGAGYEDGDGGSYRRAEHDNHIHPRVSSDPDLRVAIQTAALQPLLHLEES